MTTSRKKVGQLTVRPHIRDGVPTGRWCLDVPAKIAGKRKRMLFENRRDAEETAREVNRRVAVAGVPATTHIRNRLMFKEVADIWLEKQRLRVQTQKKRPGSLGADQYRLKVLLAHFGNDLASSIGERELLEYQDHRLREGRRPATVNSEVGTLKHILKEGTKQGAIAAVPEIERIPQRPKAVTVPSEAEIVRLLKAAPPRLRLLLAFLAETGCRKGEALNLVWEAVDEREGFATIASRDGWTPKTASSQRRVPLSSDLLAALRKLPRQGPYVFPGRDPNKPMSDFKRSLATAVKVAGLERHGKPMQITPHVLRKANATWLAMRGVHPRMLQSLLGHSPGSRITDQHYVQVTDEALRLAAIRLPLGSAIAPETLATSGNT